MGTLTVDWYNVPKYLNKGETIKLGFVADNSTNEAVSGKAEFYQIEGNRLILLGYEPFSVQPNIRLLDTTHVKFTMPDHDVRLALKYEATGQTTGTQYSQVKYWTIKLTQTPLTPRAKITKAYVVINGNNYPPGTYNVPAGTEVRFDITVKNVGPSGDIWVALMKDGKVVHKETWTLQQWVAKTAYGFGGHFIINSKTTFSVAAGHDGVTDDGGSDMSWVLNVGENPTPEKSNWVYLALTVGGIALLLNRKKK